VQEEKANRQEDATVGEPGRGGPVCVEEGSDGVYSVHTGGDRDSDNVRFMGLRNNEAGGGVRFGGLGGGGECVQDALEVTGEDGGTQGAGAFIGEGRGGG